MKPDPPRPAGNLDLLLAYAESYAQEDGVKVREDVTDLLNNVWQHEGDVTKHLRKKYPRNNNVWRHEADVTKHLRKKYPRPTNTICYKTEVNTDRGPELSNQQLCQEMG